jgi:hypothetical protein
VRIDLLITKGMRAIDCNILEAKKDASSMSARQGLAFGRRRRRGPVPGKSPPAA